MNDYHSNTSLMRIFLLSVLLCCLCAPAVEADAQRKGSQSSQEKEIDQLIRDAEQQTYSGKVTTATRTASLAVAQARELQDKLLLRRALLAAANAYDFKGDYYTARKLYREVLPLFDKNLEREMRAEILSGLGGCNGHLADNDRAAERYFEALKIYEELDLAEGITYTLNNLAVVYDNMGNTEKEIEYYNKALSVARANNLRIGEALALGNLGAVYAEEEQWQKALDHLEPALTIAESEGDDDLIIYCLNMLATIEVDQGKSAAADKQLRRALELCRKNGFGKDEYHTLLLLAEVEAMNGNFSTAFELADKCDELIEELNLFVEQNDTMELRSKIFAEQGDYRRAWELLQEFNELEEKAREEATEQKIMEIQARFDTERKENEIELLNKEKRLMNLELAGQQNTMIALGGGLFFSLLLVGAAVSLYRTKSRANRAIESKNKALATAYDEMEKLAKTDPLTGLYNRRAFYELLNYEQNKQQRSGSTHSFILADVDYFKKINDNYGHETGDQVLIWLAQRLGRQIRQQDVMCRWGGEEFILFLPDTDRRGAEALAEKLRLYLEEHNMEESTENLSVSMTFGISQWTAGERPTQAIQKADEALYFGKNSGRNCVTAYESIQEKPVN